MGRQQLPFVLKSLVERLKKYAAAEDGENAQENKKYRWSSGMAPRVRVCRESLELEVEAGGSWGVQIWSKASLKYGNGLSSGVTVWGGDLSIQAVLGLPSAWERFWFSKRGWDSPQAQQQGGDGDRYSASQWIPPKGLFWLLIRWLLRQ